MEKEEKEKKAQAELPLEEAEEISPDEIEAMNRALAMETAQDANKALDIKRKELVKIYSKECPALKEVARDLDDEKRLGILHFLRGNAKAFELIQTIHKHPDAEALIPFLLYSMETPQIFRLAHLGPGHQMLTYVPGDYVIMMLNTFFPGWSFRVTSYDTIEFKDKMVEAICHGELEIVIHGVRKTLSGTGRNPVLYRKDQDNNPTDEPVSVGNALKGAETDCIKKCASRLGIAWDVYYGMYSPRAMEAKKKAQKLQREVEVGEKQKSPSSPKGDKKILEALTKSFKLSKDEPLKSFWAKARELYDKDKKAGKMDDGTINDEIHVVATDYLEALGKFKGEGIVSVKDLSAEDLQAAIIGIALKKLHPKYFPKKP